ncbi:hypothetical protein [Peterkaempfera griseoplana]|uniref:hypothetical protein n=1 Tax=Peterkaempfera griseoplana TaxID=66896 RepID=UPI0006E1BBB4|nr:hypothetical protein [Peterkaempfera griseoplana]
MTDSAATPEEAVGNDHACGVRVVQALWSGVCRAAVSTGGEVHEFTLVTPGRRSALAAAAAFAAGPENPDSMRSGRERIRTTVLAQPDGGRHA